MGFKEEGCPKTKKRGEMKTIQVYDLNTKEILISISEYDDEIKRIAKDEIGIAVDGKDLQIEKATDVASE